MSILGTPASAVASLKEAGVRELTLWQKWLPSLRFLMSIEVHVYAFAIAANVLLSFMPFAVLMLALSRKVLHSDSAWNGVMYVLRDALPSNQDFITRNAKYLADSRKSGFVSLVLLLFTSNGTLLPLEVALNRVWGIRTHRSFLMNQVVSFGLALGCGALAFLTVVLTGAHINAVTSFAGESVFGKSLTYAGMKLVSLPLMIAVFFLLYYFLPNGKVPAKPMFRAAVFAAILMEGARFAYIWSLPLLNFQEVYGPFYVSVTLLIWAFVGSLILLVGAHASATPAATEGSK